MRILFSSIHCYLDPSSGAALCTRELLELLAARGADCRVLTTAILDPERDTTLDEVLATLELPCQRFRAEMATGKPAEVVDLTVNGVRVTVMPTASSRAERSPDRREADVFLELAGQVFDRFRPDVLLTYGGHPASLELMRRARQPGIAVAFHLLRNREAIAPRILLFVILPICVHLRNLGTRIFKSSDIVPKPSSLALTE